MARTIEIRGQVLTLSPDQDAAVDAVLAALKAPKAVAVLAGAAGTGKTTAQKAILAEWKGNVIFLAPTGIASVRLSAQTGRTARTIHSSIYMGVEVDEAKGRREKLKFGQLRAPEGCGLHTLVVVDEASMVNQDLADDLRKVVLSVGGRILAVGDHEQLPPVEGKWGFDLQNPTACLTVVHRQALESDILALATAVREGSAKHFTRWGDSAKRIQNATIEAAIEWSEECRRIDASLTAFMPEGDEKNEAPRTRVILTWTNQVRKTANRITRQRRGYPQKKIQVGETLICLYNQHDLGVMNGEQLHVLGVEPCPELTEAVGEKIVWVTVEASNGAAHRVLAVPSTFDAYHPRKSDRKVYREAYSKLYPPNQARTLGQESVGEFRHRMDWTTTDHELWKERQKSLGLQLTWGYCLTVHKSQGSEWDEVGFISCPGYRKPERLGGRLSPENKRRLTYTAITRAAETFTAFVMDVMPDYRRRDPYGASK